MKMPRAVCPCCDVEMAVGPPKGGDGSADFFPKHPRGDAPPCDGWGLVVKPEDYALASSNTVVPANDSPGDSQGVGSGLSEADMHTGAAVIGREIDAARRHGLIGSTDDAGATFRLASPGEFAVLGGVCSRHGAHVGGPCPRCAVMDADESSPGHQFRTVKGSTVRRCRNCGEREDALRPNASCRVAPDVSVDDEEEAHYLISEAQMDSIVDSIAAPLLDAECRRVVHQVLGAAAACGVTLVHHSAARESAPVEQAFPIPQVCPHCAQNIDICKTNGLVYVSGLAPSAGVDWPSVVRQVVAYLDDPSVSNVAARNTLEQALRRSSHTEGADRG